jgi:hypothetical protein
MKATGTVLDADGLSAVCTLEATIADSIREGSVPAPAVMPESCAAPSVGMSTASETTIGVDAASVDALPVHAKAVRDTADSGKPPTAASAFRSAETTPLETSKSGKQPGRVTLNASLWYTTGADKDEALTPMEGVTLGVTLRDGVVDALLDGDSLGHGLPRPTWVVKFNPHHAGSASSIASMQPVTSYIADVMLY